MYVFNIIIGFKKHNKSVLQYNLCQSGVLNCVPDPISPKAGAIVDACIGAAVDAVSYN
jgi:hypothetical protein